MEKEEFRNIKGYEGMYEASNLGNVKSLKCGKERILKAGVDTGGYCIVNLSKDGEQKARKVHQLVAVAFLGHKPCGMKLVVNHIDIDKLNNNVSNLEIVTSRENSNKKHIKSTSKFVGVSWHKANKKWLAQILINGKLKYLGCFTNELSASNAYQNELLILKTK